MSASRTIACTRVGPSPAAAAIFRIDTALGVRAGDRPCALKLRHLAPPRCATHAREQPRLASPRPPPLLAADRHARHEREDRAVPGRCVRQSERLSVLEPAVMLASFQLTSAPKRQRGSASRRSRMGTNPASRSPTGSLPRPRGKRPPRERDCSRRRPATLHPFASATARPMRPRRRPDPSQRACHRGTIQARALWPGGQRCLVAM